MYWMPSTIGFRVFLPFFSSCQPMPSSRPCLVQPWFQLVMPSTSPHLKSFFKGLGGPKRSGSLQKSHFRETISKIVHWGFSVPPSDTVTKDFAPGIPKTLPPHHSISECLARGQTGGMRLLPLLAVLELAHSYAEVNDEQDIVCAAAGFLVLADAVSRIRGRHYLRKSALPLPQVEQLYALLCARARGRASAPQHAVCLRVLPQRDREAAPDLPCNCGRTIARPIVVT